MSISILEKIFPVVYTPGMDAEIQQIQRLLSGYMTAAEVAEELGVSKPRVQQIVNTGRLAPAFCAGGVRWFRRSDVAAFGRLDRPRGRRPKSDGSPAP